MTLPNWISIGRLVAVPVIVAALLTGAAHVALVLFALAALSDAVDGAIARHFDMRSELGEWLDPAADKLLINALVIALAVMGAFPVWFAGLVIVRDGIIVAGAMLASRRGRRAILTPLFVGKLTTAALFASVLVELLHLVIGSAGLDVVRTAALWAASVFTLASIVVYTARWRREMQRSGRTTERAHREDGQR